jgi:hypothetical protein
MGVHIFDHFQPPCFHDINKFNELQVFFLAMGKVRMTSLWQIFYDTHYSQGIQGFETKLHL